MDRVKTLVLINKNTPYVTNNQITKKDITDLFKKYEMLADVLVIAPDEIARVVDQTMNTSEYQLVVVGGGDGTVNAVVNKIINKKIHLAVLPLGTLNHFAKDLGLPMDIEECIKLCRTGEVQQVDVGKVNDVYFLNNSSVGLYPKMVKGRDQQMHWYRSNKWWAVFWSTINIFHRFPLFRVRLTAEEKSLERTTPLVFIGNNEYEYSLFTLKSRTNIQQGILCFYIVSSRSRWQFFKLLCSALLGRLKQSKYFKKLLSKEAMLDSPKKELEVAVDGEIIYLKTPLQFTNHPRALSVIKPKMKDNV